MSLTTDFTGKLLIAMPGMADPRFTGAVVYICAHSEEGAMGLMINRAAEGVSAGNLFKQLDMVADGPAARDPVLSGGPVENERGFVLHSTDYESDLSTLQVKGGIAMTGTIDVLDDMANGKGPQRALVMLGYCGWGQGQLEGEMSQNAWLTCDGDADLVLSRDLDHKWEAALAKLGVNPLTLSATAGRA